MVLCSLIIAAVLALTVTGEPHYASVVQRPDGTLEVRRDATTHYVTPTPVATINFTNEINSTGWAFLELTTDVTKDDSLQAYAAGLLEGCVTQELIYMHWVNTMRDFCDGQEFTCQRVQGYLNTNREWVRTTLDNNNQSAYWHQVNLFYSQLQGLADGYSQCNKDELKNLTYNDLLWLNVQGDLEDLMEALKPEGSQTDHRKVLGSGSCSALIKLLPGGSDLLVAHDTWSSFQSMLRVQKKYIFHFHQTPTSAELIHGVSMTFTSYPGIIQSADDYYLISSGLVTMETTIGNSNVSLWSHVQAEGQVIEGVRAMVSNRLGHCGMSWTKIFSQYNSGTYNNQWMVVDYKRFKPGTAQAQLKDKLLWVLEQIPGHVMAADRTDVLRDQSYWPSYNAPSFKEIFDLSGNQEMVLKFGDWFTYDKTPRALIFKRDHGKVRDLDSMMALMRYNDFRHDPLSRCACVPPYSGENAIAARNDLNPANGTYPFGALGHRSHAATDAKVTSSELFLKLQFLAVSGPIHDENIPAFQWSTSDYRDSTPHLGHPDLWKFEPLVHEWQWTESRTIN